jgi:Ni,Fe-hydrogenase III large subunit
MPLLVARGSGPLAGREPAGGLALIERLSGDTPVGHALAYCRAVEDALGLYVPEDARRMRAVLGELERLHRHLDDLATLCRCAGLEAAHAEARRLVELLLRTNHAMTGSRSLRGGILVAGAAVRRVVDADALVGLGGAVARLVGEAVADPRFERRLRGTATLTTAQARDLGALGVVARASGVDVDARRDHPTDVLADFGLQLGDILPVPVQDGGDVLARFQQRGTEIAASVAALDTLVRTVNPGLVANWPTAEFRRPGPAGVSGVGISEGWRGTIVHRVEIDPNLRIADARVVDPSFFNRPALEAALPGTAPDDVPLARISFNVPSFTDA